MNIGKDNQANRDAWLARRLAAIPAGQSILNAGAGEPQHKRFCSHLRYTDKDIAAITAPDGAFDNVMCIEVLAHVPDPVAVLRDVARAVRPGGRLILTAPFCSLTHLEPRHFASGFNRYFYQHHLAALGFDEIEVTANGDYFSYLAQELRRVPSVARRHARGAGPLLYLGRWLALMALERARRRDGGSSELLCYGFHVTARRAVPATDTTP